MPFLLKIEGIGISLMNILGIITEYNPFHNGHLYHLNQALELTDANYVICIMSGNFVQRGEAALFDKWKRTEMALRAGVDLVLELPVSYALRSAEYFASGAVQLLNKSGLVSKLLFGSEIGSIKPLFQIAKVLVNEPSLLSNLIKKELAKGVSFPRARALALEHYFQKNNITLNVKEIINNPNNILGIEYIKSLISTNSSIEALTIKRQQANYHQEEIQDEISSATAIRKQILSNRNLKSIEQVVPATTKSIIAQAKELGQGPNSLQDFELAILTLIRRLSATELTAIEDVTPGLANRIKEAGAQACSLRELLELIKTKRFTRTRIQRILSHLLLGLKKNSLEEFRAYGPQYLRILGFLKSSQELLQLIKKNSQLPLISKVADYYQSHYTPNSLLEKMLALDIQASNIYSLAYSNQKYRKSAQDYRAPIILENSKNQ